MLRLAGYLPDFTHCVACAEALDLTHTSHYPFFLIAGGFLCPTCFHHTTDVQRVNVSTTTLKLFLTPDDEDLHGNAIKAHKFLDYYWGHRLERPLKSFAFLFQLLEQQGVMH
jgi:recombinational DNA repair protein (RecF pathway)